MNTFEKYKTIYKDEGGATLKPLGEACRFSLLMYATSTSLLTVMFFLTRKKAKDSPNEIPDENKNRKAFFVVAIICAAIVFLLNQTVATLSGRLDAVLTFTMTNGAKLLLVTIVSLLYYKEKLTVQSAIGMILMLASVGILSV